MTRSKLKSIIQEIVYRKLSEQLPSDSKSDDAPDSTQPKLSDAEQKKLADLRGKSAELTQRIQGIEDNTSELHATIQTRVERNERQLAKDRRERSRVNNKINALVK